MGCVPGVGHRSSSYDAGMGILGCPAWLPFLQVMFNVQNVVLRRAFAFWTLAEEEGLKLEASWLVVLHLLALFLQAPCRVPL